MKNKQSFFIRNKKLLFILIIIIVIIFLSIFISKNVIKKQKNGNNMNSQEIVDNILNLKSYKSKISVQVNSNKNQNKYILTQEYNTENGCIQEIIEPENIAGVKILADDDVADNGFNEFNLQNLHPFCTFFATRPKEPVPKLFP